MKTVGRRIRRLEEQAKPVMNECGKTLVDVLRARRRIAVSRPPAAHLTSGRLKTSSVVNRTVRL